ncbi:MAG TPA: T9SS type A sorting domain-containing protein [Flavobacterium sp.]|nr:T9SS type A sorting domain-containing protein [Flavobacterium sp.]
MKKNILLFLLFSNFFLFSQTFNWNNLPNAPYNGGKQDGIYFFNKDIGWSVNGSGKIHKTIDGGDSWIQQKNSPGTYFRSIAFINDQIGFAGNVGINYFPGVSDTNPLYKTIDGGNSWSPVTSNITGTVPTGICAIQVVNPDVIYAAGRVGGPAVIMKSIDGGSNWVGTTLPATCKMILDIHFQSPNVGYVFAATDTNIAFSKARILKTIDGGLNWTIVYTSTRNYELMWKAWFPSSDVGYASIQSYDSSTTQRYIVKTTDGGNNWSELPIANDGVREFGIAFIDDNVGWVGGENGGYETLDGGLTWTPKNIGDYANKFSVINNPDGTKTAFAIGLNIYKLTANSLATNSFNKKRDNIILYPNPAASGQYISLSFENIEGKIVKAEIVSITGKVLSILFDNYYEGTRESPFMFKLPNLSVGEYILKVTNDKGNLFTQKVLISQ